MSAYYNEHDRHAAAWLRELMVRDLITPGEVDERSIEEVTPNDLRGFVQCHFFAGLGVWSYALRGAGWADATPVWTGSCPCQPFSASGKGRGTDDHRHLWPSWFRLIRECQPDVCFGEQVASKDGLAWLDLVSADLEGAGYSIGACDTCAAGVGAPHIRQRLYFVADANGGRGFEDAGNAAHLVESGLAHRIAGSVGDSEIQRCDAELERRASRTADRQGQRLERACTAGIVDDPERSRLEGHAGNDGGAQRREGSERSTAAAGVSDGLANAHPRGLGVDGGSSSDGRAPQGVAHALERSATRGVVHTNGTSEVGESIRRQLGRTPSHGAAGATSGFWHPAEWIACRDGKARPIEPGSLPLVTGAPARVVRLRGYGNAICAPQATAFIEAYLDVRGAA